MSDIIWLFSVLGSLLTLLLVILIVWKGRRTNLADDDDDDDGKPEQLRGVPVPRPGSNDDAPFRRVRNRRNRPTRVQQIEIPEPVGEEDDEDDDHDGDDDGPEDDPLAGVEGKIGVKKRRKLEMKAEKKAARERDLQEREERKQRQAMLDEERRKKEEAEKEEERKREEEERRIKEEKERQEHEEYLKMKAAFEIEEEGFDQDTDENEQSNKLQAFIDYIKNEKVVLLEDLAGNFQMKTQDAINRLTLLLEEQELTGVIDDRGKFIYITNDELENIAKFIRRRGRVALSELVENSNQLIQMKV